MLDPFFITIHEWISGATALAALGCFVWGIISVVFSPCHLASIPLIVAYVGGQQKILRPGEAGFYSVAFTSGLFITITLTGIICALLGRMLGDMGNYWQVLIGFLLVWVALGMLGVEKCSIPGSLLYKLNFRGLFGAFGLGLAYGILSGSCTFGFIAPILAIVKTDFHRNSFHPALRYRSLPAYFGSRQFDGCSKKGHGEQHLAGRRNLVAERSRSYHCNAWGLFYC